MAHNRIGRRIQKTTCKGDYYTRDNHKQSFSISVWGHYDVDQMTRKIRAILETDRFLIDPDSLEYSEFWCSMSIDDFIANGEHSPHRPRKQKEV